MKKNQQKQIPVVAPVKLKNLDIKDLTLLNQSVKTGKKEIADDIEMEL